MTKEERVAFEAAVYDIVKMIPPGRATSYAAIAKAVGYPKHSRMVGRIMADCNSAVSSIPAHRVVNSQGVLSGKAAFGSSGEMQALLISEGIIVKNNRIGAWNKVFWNPMDEIRLSASEDPISGKHTLSRQ